VLDCLLKVENRKVYLTWWCPSVRFLLASLKTIVIELTLQTDKWSVFRWYGQHADMAFNIYCVENKFDCPSITYCVRHTRDKIVTRDSWLPRSQVDGKHLCLLCSRVKIKDFCARVTRGVHDHAGEIRLSNVLLTQWINGRGNSFKNFSP
jgi:hypothetical protein